MVHQNKQKKTIVIDLKPVGVLKMSFIAPMPEQIAIIALSENSDDTTMLALGS